MAIVAIHLPEEQNARLEELARRWRVPIDDLATAAVLDFLAKPGQKIEKATELVLSKNSELYRRPS